MKILVAIHSPFAMWTVPISQVERLRREFPQHDFLHAADERTALTLIPDAEVAFSSQVTAELLRAAPLLRWIHSPAAGVGAMLFPEMVRSAVVITNSRGLAADTIAEHVLAVTLALFRRLPLALRRQAGHEWAQDEIGSPPGNRTLPGTHVVVIGLGAIGGAVARTMTALGARVSAIRRHIDRGAPAGIAHVAGPDRLFDLLPTADVVVIAAPQTSETRCLIGARELAVLSPRAILVNVSRGKLVDEAALTTVLQTGALAGAALDVFAHEPLSPESPLWDLPNVLITPHTSGFRPDHWDAAVSLFAENLRRHERGEALVNVVDKNAGY